MSFLIKDANDAAQWIPQSAMANSDLPRTFLYESRATTDVTADTLAEIIAADYFLGIYVQLRVGDWIDVIAVGYTEPIRIIVTAVSKTTVTVAVAGATLLAIADYDSAGVDSDGDDNIDVGAHGLGVYIPDNAIITKAYYDVGTTFTSADDSATIALSILAADDLVAAIAISAANPGVYDAGIRDCLPGNYALSGDAASAIVHAALVAASAIKMTSSKELTATVAVQPLVLGKLRLFVEYVMGL
jgi:hypothetical protein